MNQLSLLPDPLEVRFVEWLRDNGHVIDHLRAMAVEWYRAGHDHGAIATFVEVARWQHGLRSTGDTFAINNSYRSYLARHIMATTPELPADFFAFRVLRSEAA
jgi:hypothetical protein